MTDQKRQNMTGAISGNVTATTGGGMAESAADVCGYPTLAAETIQVEQVLGANMMQRVVEADMTVPDPKPDIEQIIDVFVKNLEITNIAVIPNKVVVRGDFEIKVMYVAALPDKPVHAFELPHVRWTRDIPVEGATPDMKATADAMVEYINFDFDPADPRQVHITVVLKVWTRVVTTTEVDVSTLMPYEETAMGEMPAGGGPQMGGGVPPGNVVVSGPGLTPTAGTSMGVSGTATVTGSRVNVRTGPGTNFPVVTQVNKGDTVTLKDQAFGWYKVVLADGVTTGWIAGWLMNVGAPKG
jgi:hypothetical protein